MKRVLALILCILLAVGCSIPASCEEPANDITFTETTVQINPEQRSSTVTAKRERTFLFHADVIATIAITATFQYNGLSVSVVSMSVTQCQTYNGWSFTQTSFTGSGSSVLLKGKLTHPSHSDVDVSISLACDPDGNIY